MAILNKIRQRSIFLIAIIALALFAFVIQGVLDNPRAFSGSQDIVATINGKDIDRIQFNQKVKNYQDQTGGRLSETQAKNSIYNQELRRIIMESEYETLGLSVESNEVLKLLENSTSSYPEFQNEDGSFNIEKLKAFVANLKEISPDVAILTVNGQPIRIDYNNWATFENNLSVGALQQSYYNLIKAGLGATILEAEDNYLGDAEKVDISFVQIPFTTIADSLVEVKKSDIKKYIEKHESDYKVDASRELMYVEFKEAPSKADEEAIKANLLAMVKDRIEYNPNSKNNDTISGFDSAKDIANFINTNSDITFNDNFLRAAELPSQFKDSILNLTQGAYFGPYKDGDFFKLSKLIETKQLPDSVKVRHILIPFTGGQRAGADVTKTPEEAKKTADSILTVLKGNRSKFKALLNLSSDKVSNEKEGVIEFAYNSSFAPEFKAFSFDNKKGDIDVVQTSFGYHIIEILDQTNFNKTVKVATLADKIEPSQETLDEVFNNMSKFEIAVKNGDFNAIAKERDLQVKPLEVKELDENIPGLGSQREVVRWAFNEETEVDDFKNFSISGVGFIVAKLVNKKPEGLMSVEDASVTVLPIIRNEEKAKLIKDKITATTVQEIAKNQNQSVKTAKAVTMNNTTLSGAGVEPKIVGAIFGLNEGETSKPINGEKGVYVIEVTKIEGATKLDNYAPIMNRLSTTRRNSAQGKVYQALEEVADIEDNRAETVY